MMKTGNHVKIQDKISSLIAKRKARDSQPKNNHEKKPHAELDIL